MRILLVHPRIYAGGAEKAVIYLAHNLNRMGHEAAICTLSTHLSLLPAKVKALHFIHPHPQLRLSSMSMESTSDAVRRVVLETRELTSLIQKYVDGYDVLSPCNFPAYWSTYPQRSRKPIVWISSEVFGPYDASRDLYHRSPFFRAAVKATTSIDRYIVRSSVDRIVTCSPLNQQLIMERYGLPATVIPTAVDYQFFHPTTSMDDEVVDEEGVDEDYVLLQVGTLIKRKNQILSIRALSRLKKHIPEVKLIIVGEGPWELILRKEVHRLRLEGKVIFTGAVSEQQLVSLYHHCDLALFPAEDQTFGLVPFEALAAGKLSLVSQNSGAGRLMGELGICYPITPTVDSVVKGVLQVWRNPHQFQDSIAKGHAYVRERLTWDRYAEEMSKIYEAG